MKVLTKMLCSALAVITLFFGTRNSEQMRNTDKLSETYLIVGLDDAAENTDVISLLNVGERGRLSLLQIPRDTYITVGSRQSKLNGYYPIKKSSGATSDEAMSALAELINDVFGISINGYVALTTDTVRGTIDALGGVDIDLPEAVELSGGVRLERGVNHLDADRALSLIRHRSSYKRADLDRLDVQGLFYEAMLERMLGASLADAYAVYRVFSKNGITSLSLSDAVRLFGKREMIRGQQLTRFTLPGEAVKSTSGTWYYSVRRSSSAALISDIFGITADNFDKNKILLNKSEQNFINIYYS